MSLETQLQLLNENLVNLVQKIHENTQAGHRIINTLNPPAPSGLPDEPSAPQQQELLLPTPTTAPSRSQSDEPAPAPSPVKRNRRSKAQIEADKLLEQQVEADPDSVTSAAREQAHTADADPFADDTAADPFVESYTMADVREAAVKFREAKGLVEGRLLLAKFELGGLADLQPERYGEFIKACAV